MQCITNAGGFPYAFFPRLHLHHVASQRKSRLLFPLYGFMFLSLQVELLFIVGFATDGIEPRAFAAICFALTHSPEIAALRTVLTSAAWICCYLVCKCGAGEEDTQISQLCTYNSIMYFSWSQTSWILHEAHLNMWNAHRSPNGAVIRYVLPCS